jgi:hypothetical protein
MYLCTSATPATEIRATATAALQQKTKQEEGETPPDKVF